MIILILENMRNFLFLVKLLLIEDRFLFSFSFFSFFLSFSLSIFKRQLFFFSVFDTQIEDWFVNFRRRELEKMRNGKMKGLSFEETIKNQKFLYLLFLFFFFFFSFSFSFSFLWFFLKNSRIKKNTKILLSKNKISPYLFQNFLCCLLLPLFFLFFSFSPFSSLPLSAPNLLSFPPLSLSLSLSL